MMKSREGPSGGRGFGHYAEIVARMERARRLSGTEPESPRISPTRTPTESRRTDCGSQPDAPGRST